MIKIFYVIITLSFFNMSGSDKNTKNILYGEDIFILTKNELYRKKVFNLLDFIRKKSCNDESKFLEECINGSNLDPEYNNIIKDLNTSRLKAQWQNIDLKLKEAMGKEQHIEKVLPDIEKIFFP